MSPFKSKKQQRFLFAKHPKIAKRWADEDGISEDLVEKVMKLKKGGKNKQG